MNITVTNVQGRESAGAVDLSGSFTQWMDLTELEIMNLLQGVCRDAGMVVTPFPHHSHLSMRASFQFGKGAIGFLIEKRIDDIDKSTIDSLVTNSVSERRTLDYKESLPGSADDDKREFLTDVASFANASGGDIVYGVADERDEKGRATGIPCSAEGVSISNIGEHKARLESSARDGIAPRIPGIEFRIVDGFSKGPVLVVRIPKSWIGPHMVTFKNFSRFFSRNSTGKYQLDVGEIRSAFIESTLMGDKLRNFRAERISKALQGETAVPLGNGVKMVLHLVPLSSMSPGRLRDVTAEASKLTQLLRPMQEASYLGRYNLDGFFVD